MGGHGVTVTSYIPQWRQIERRVVLDTHARRIEAIESRYPADRYAFDLLLGVEPEPAR